MNATRLSSSSGRRLFFPLVAAQLLALAVNSVVPVSATPEWADVPPPGDAAFLMLADGRRIDAVWEWGDQGSGQYVLKESAGTEQERPFSVPAGEVFEATLHYSLAPAWEVQLTGVRIEFLLQWAEGQASAMRTVDSTAVSFLPQEPGEPAVSEPFRLTVPSAISEAARSEFHSWFLLLQLEPLVYGGPSLDLDVEFPDASRPRPGDDSPWGPYLGQQPPGREPAVFAPGIVSTKEGFELNSVFSQDGREFLFARRVGKALKIFSSSQDAGGHWLPPEMVEFSRANSQWDEVDMWFSPRGYSLLYISNAPAPGFAEGSVNIWRTARQGPRWLKPWILSGPLNTDGHEIYPMLLANGNLYFSSTREGGFGGRDIYVATAVAGGFDDVSNLGANVNSPADEGDVYVAPDESYLVVTSNREGGLGKSDLYISLRQPGGGWGELRNLGVPINSEETDYSPVVSSDGRYFFFSRAGDIYWLDAAVLEEYR